MSFEMVLLVPGHKDFVQHGAVRYLLGEEPKSPSFTMRGVTRLCLLTAGEKTVLVDHSEHFQGYKRPHSDSTCGLEMEKGVLVCVLLLML